MNKKGIHSFIFLAADRVYKFCSEDYRQKKVKMKKACCKEIIIKGNVINYTINQMTKEKSNFLFIHILFCSSQFIIISNARTSLSHELHSSEMDGVKL